MVTETLYSNAYVLGISKAKAIQDIFKVVYNRIVNNVTDPNSPARAKWWYSAFPDEDINNAAAYPLGIINSPELVWGKFSLTKKQVTATMVIEIYSTSTRQMDDLADQTITAMETSRADFTAIGLRFINLDTTTTDMVMRDKIKIHMKSMIFTGKYNFTKSS